MKAKIWSRKSSSDRKLPRLSSLRTRILSQISTWFIQDAWMARVVNDYLVRRVMQECGTAFHRVENPAFAFNTQCLWRDAFPLGNPAHQRFGLMDVEIVQDDV